MPNPIPGNVYAHADLLRANALYQKMRIFPTPFKGIYYVPYESERSGWYVTDPHRIIFKAVRLYLKSENYYFGLSSALYYLRIIWNAAGVDILNVKYSRKLTRKLPSKKYWRGKIICKIMQAYPYPIRFHRIKNFGLEGVVRQGPIRFSTLTKTKADAIYLCHKGDKTACEVWKLLEKKNR